MQKNTNRTIAVITISTLVGIANFWHVLTQWSQNPPDRYFAWIAHYYADYFLYVSQMAEGARGSWIWSRSLFTNEPIADTWIYWPNVLMGKLGSFLTLSPFVIYTVSLAAAAICLFWLIASLTRMTFQTRPGAQIVAFLFAVTASNAVDIGSFFQNGRLILTHPMWFSPSPALNRIGGVPHQTLQTILLLGVVALGAMLMQNNREKHTSHRLIPFVFPVMCFLAATVSPVQMLILSTALIASLLLLRLPIRQNIAIGIGLIGAAISAVMVNNAFDSSPIYTAAKTWEATQMVDVSLWELLLSLGPVMLFIPFGLSRFTRQSSPIRLILTCYGALAIVLFATGIPKALNTSPTRWIHPASFLLWYFIAADGWIILSEKLKHIILKTKIISISSGKQIAELLPSLLIIIYICLTIPSIFAQVESRSAKENAPALYSDINHIPLPVVAILTQLQKSPRTGTVLMDPALPYDGLVPIISGKRTFTGHPIHTLYPETKQQLRERFFSGLMQEDEAARFINDHTITHIVYSPATAQKIPLLPFLSQSAANHSAILYEVAH